MKKEILLLLLMTLLAACSGGSGTSPTTPITSAAGKETAVVATTAADYSSGAVSVLTKDSQGQLSALNNLVPNGSDLSIAAYGRYFYRINRFGNGNNITKYAIDAPQTSLWQFSVQDSNSSSVSSNPHDMVFVSDTRAYVLRYGSTRAWIVNPAANSEANFKTGELDLSAYGGTDGIPEMDSAVIADGKLFITLQRLEGPVLQPDNISYLAVFDIKTDKEIDVGIAGDTLKGIPLLVRNPTKILYDRNSDSIYVLGSGSTLPPLKYVGGIEKINATSYKQTLILDDGNNSVHPYGVFFQMALVAPDTLYFVGYQGWQNNTLYRLNMVSGKVAATTIPQLINGDIADLEVDQQGRLWVADDANATVRVIDPVSGDQLDAVYTILNPEKIVFIH